MKKFAVAAAFVAAVAAAFVLGRFSRPAVEPQASAEPDDACRPRQAAPVDPTNALKAQIAALKKKVAALEREKETATETEKPAEEPLPEAETPPTTERARPMPGPFGSLAEIRKNDPARYAEITNNMARFEARRLRRAQSRLDTLAQVSTDGFTQRERETHDQLQELLVRREELSARMRAAMEDESVTDEDRRAAFDEMRELHEDIRRLERQERNALLTATAKNLGLAGEDAAAFVDTVKTIYEVTGMEDRGPGGHGPGRHGDRPPRER